MAVDVVVPKQGWTMEEGTFLGWLKEDGEAVVEGEPLFILETEKATQEVEAIESGTLRISAAAPDSDETVPVGTLLGHILQEGETVPAASTSDSGAERPMEPAAVTPRRGGTSARSSRPPPISPRARRVAGELGVDAASLSGTGSTGRIVARDIRQAANSQQPQGGIAVRATAKRNVIAAHMAMSSRSTAAVTLTTDADATELVLLRQRLQAAASSSEAAPTYTDLIIKLTSLSLSRHPALNSQWRDDGVVILDEIHIGVAVDTEHGLTVPVLHNVAEMTRTEIATTSRSLAEKARARRLSPRDAEGGTFTITNLGSYGIDAFTPIINAPQCAILGVGRIVRKPWVHEDQIVVRERMVLSLTFDHRAIDGGPAARFLGTLRELIEQPDAVEASRNR